MKKTIILLLSSVCACLAQDTFRLENSSPYALLGAVDMREARIVTSPRLKPSDLDVCWKAKSTDVKIKASIDLYNRNCHNEVIFENLEPNTEYKYIVNGISGSFKTKPDYLDKTPPPDFTFVALGDNYINDPKYDPPFKTNGAEFEIFKSILDTKPAFAIWVGSENCLRNADLGSKSAIFNRLLQARLSENSKQFFNNIANYAVPNSDKISDSTSIGAANKMSAFDRLWANPQGSDKTSRAYSFSYSDVDFFVLDDFSNRTNLDYEKNVPQMLGEAQLKWLFGALNNSKAIFKFIIMNTPIANPVESDANFTFAREERKALFDFLSNKQIEGIIMISGKKGYGEITKLVRAGAYPIYEVTTPPLTARPEKEVKEMNYFRLPSSAILKRAFTQIKIEGAEKSRIATITFFNAKGEPEFSTSIKQQGEQSTP